MNHTQPRTVPRRLTVLAAASMTLAAGAAQAPAAPAARHSAHDAAQLVATIYDAYQGAADAKTLGGCFVGSRAGCATTTVRHVPAALRATLRLRAENDQGDPVICSQNTPHRLSYSAPRVHGSRATILVHTFYSAMPRTDNRIRVDVDLRTLELTALTCAGEFRNRRVPPQPARVVLNTDPAGSQEVRPHTIDLGIDGTLRLKRLAWRHWGSPIATAAGVIAIRGCDPSCATSDRTFVYPVTVSAHQIVSCPDRRRQYAFVEYAVTDSASFEHDLPALAAAGADDDGDGIRGYDC